jgi:hypothetical protein
MATPSFMTEPVTHSDSSDAPKTLAPRLEWVAGMLKATNRTVVPIREDFVQIPRKRAVLKSEKRAGVLASLVKAGRSPALDAYLLVHAMASASDPYTSAYPAMSWAHALGFDETTGDGTPESTVSAKSQWSKVTRRLVELKILARHREGNTMIYTLLHESGNGQAYARPKTKDDDRWFNLPHVYWTQEWYQKLGLSAKAMLLIALASKDSFALPFDRAPEWYGISRSTAQRGMSTLIDEGIVDATSTWVMDVKSRTGWREERHYRLTGPWSSAERRGTRPRASKAEAPTPKQATDPLDP